MFTQIDLTNNTKNSVLLTQSQKVLAPANQKSESVSIPVRQSTFAYSGVYFGANQNTNIQTVLRTQEEQSKFLNISNQLNLEGKNLLNNLLKNGRLLKNNSNDKSTTLDNLHNIKTLEGFYRLVEKLQIKKD